MAETHIPSDHPAVKAEPSVFTGDGTYRLRDGTELFIEQEESGVLTCGENARALRSPCFWARNGKWVSGDFHDEYDIVSRVDDEPKQAGLKDYLCLRPGYAPMETSHPERYGPAWTIIDLSTITKDQLVQPNPEPKKVRGFFNVYRNVQDEDIYKLVGPYDNRHGANILPGDKRIACIEVEFVEGQGLGDES